MRRLPILAGLLVMSIGSASAEQTADVDNLRKQVLAVTNGRLERVAEQMQSIFISIDRDGSGITGEEITTARAADSAAFRAMRLGRAIQEIAQYDLDGDGVVSHPEIGSALRYNTSRGEMFSNGDDKAVKRIKQMVDLHAEDLFARYDLNADGRLEMSEVLSASTEQLAGKSPVKETSRLEVQLAVAGALMPFDADRDGRLSQLEAMAAIVKAFENYKPACTQNCNPT